MSCNGLIGEGGEEGVQRERQGYRGEEVQGGRYKGGGTRGEVQGGEDTRRRV